LDISAVIETLFVNIGNLGGGGKPNTAHRKNLRKHKRSCRIEELEPREMLSVNMLGFDVFQNDNLDDTGFVDVHSPPLEGWHFAQQNDGVVADAQDDHPAAARYPSTGGELVAPAPSVANAPPGTVEVNGTFYEAGVIEIVILKDIEAEHVDREHFSGFEFFDSARAFMFT
jgi:hypothetical protein